MDTYDHSMDDVYIEEGVDYIPESQAYNFNPDSEWQMFIQSAERMIIKIANKYCSDDDLRKDVEQEARVAVATLRPEDCQGFEAYSAGETTEDQWNKTLRRYIHNTIRNSVLSYLDSYPKGNWYIGRTRHVKDKVTGATKKVYLPPRFSSLDFLMDEHGMQIDEAGEVSWPDPADDGLLHKTANESHNVERQHKMSKFYQAAIPHPTPDPDSDDETSS